MAWCILAGGKTLPMVVLILLSMAGNALSERRQLQVMQDPVVDVLMYHGGAVLTGDVPVSIVWYGKFKPSQKEIVVDFVSDEAYSLGKTLTLVQVFQLAAGASPRRGAVVIVLTDPDVAVEGLCSVRCGLHGSDAGAGYAYAWAGNAERQCPGQCAWPFARPAYGPQDPPLGAPKGDVGVDGMVVTLASMLAGAVTNPFGDAYYQGDKDAALEACTACAGVYGSCSYPGYAGKVLVDKANGGSYNAIGVNGKRFLLPAIYNPATASCSTSV
ncbi:hypothetical protein E2562_019065 [Oryza meyeriana var. granulata]|uniref:Uncharacterized protein n=1 Tax=Oryza meyeriana var. granulata TaxID=110450 RepID=A0A6G1CS73_9ORYZ|nr:hypothetical protein E2562_019065 [Oryza meyeriana var. granulata]